ncbi:uncharacterized protein LOC128179137 [Crassostrea angulata]|uniref:Claudin n=1 Tax=Magallana gigas TaxID=29159 RepID=A0A8W8N6Z6_MAGGI|nr:uncharacterized protein LOC117689201 [Crassostrea gigas]XP_052702569.1 uncharacterized protein LOC128179137 [Crassostrea angulata]XP_052702570.1 uncharacterized protein LOC128179137 [Crassostrea angulata]
MDSSKLFMIALVLNICALVFQIIGVAPPYWAYIEFGTSKVYSGLWTQCTEVLGTTSCSDVAYSEGWFELVRAFSILGLLLLIVAVVMTVLKLFVMKDKKPVLFVGIGTSFAGGFLIFIAITVYAADLNDLLSNLTFTFHFAFAFSILAMIMAFAGGAILLLGMIKE